MGRRRAFCNRAAPKSIFLSENGERWCPAAGGSWWISVGRTPAWGWVSHLPACRASGVESEAACSGEAREAAKSLDSVRAGASGGGCVARWWNAAKNDDDKRT